MLPVRFHGAKDQRFFFFLNYSIDFKLPDEPEQNRNKIEPSV